MRLRPRLLALVVGAGAAPLLWVGATAWVEAGRADALRARAEAAAAAVRDGADPTAVAQAQDVRVRIEAGSRTLVWAEPSGPWPDPGDPLDGCRADGARLVCAVTVPAEGERRVRVEATAPRPLRALGRDPVALLQLVLAGGGLVAGWGWLVGREVMAAARRLEGARRDAEARVRALEAELATTRRRADTDATATRAAAAVVAQVRDALRRGPAEPGDAGGRGPALAAKLDEAARRLEATGPGPDGSSVG